MSSPLSDLIPEDAILLDAEAADWAAAVKIAGQLLETTGVTTADYTQAMVDNVVDHGPYIVIAPGFAFAHARPSEAVLRTGMSWVRLKEPVSFGHSEHDPVSLVVALAATDSRQHVQAMANLAEVIGDDEARAALETVSSPGQLRAVLGGDTAAAAEPATAPSSSSSSPAEDRHLILTVCGNGLGTSLFLKNTLEDVLSTWGWDRHVSVEATDTISARGRAKESKAILTSGEIAKTLGDVGVPVRVVENFTSKDELDRALRELYDV